MRTPADAQIETDVLDLLRAGRPKAARDLLADHGTGSVHALLAGMAELEAGRWSAAVAAWAVDDPASAAWRSVGVQLAARGRAVFADEPAGGEEPAAADVRSLRRALDREIAQAPAASAELEAWLIAGLLHLGHPTLAQQRLVRADATHPDDVLLFAVRIGILREQHRWEEVVLSCKEPVAQAAADPRWLVAHACALRMLSRNRQAREVILRALARFPHEASVHLELGEIEAARNEWTAAADSYQHAIDRSPRLAAAWAGLARARRKLGCLEDCAELVRVALASGLESKSLQVERSAVAIALHDYEEASLACDAVLAYDADDFDAQKKRKFARRRTGQSPIVPRVAARLIGRETHSNYDIWSSRRPLAREVLGPRADVALIAADRYSWRRSRLFAIRRLSLPAAAFTSGFVFLLNAVFVFLVLDAKRDLSPWETSIAVSIAPLLAVALIDWCLTIGRGRLAVIAGIASFYGAVGSLLAAETKHLPGAVATYAAKCGFVLASMTLATTLTLIFLVSRLLDTYQARLRRADPLSAIVVSLIAVLARLREAPETTTQIRLSTDVYNLEDAAYALRHLMNRQRPTGDRRTDDWLAHRAEGVAAGMRGLKKWVLSPGAETVDSLDERIVTDLRSIVLGRWRDLPVGDPDNAKRRRLLGIAVVRNVVIAVAPMGALLIAQSLNLITLGSAEGQARAGALAWCLLTLLVTLDPDFELKRDTIEHALSALRRGERGPGE